MRAAPGAMVIMLLSHAAIAGTISDVTIVPRPASIEMRDGTFVLRTNSVIVAEPAVAAEARRLASALAPAMGAPPKTVVTRHVASARRRFHLCARKARGPGKCRSWIRFHRTRRHPAAPEAYTLDVAPGVVTIRAADAAGLFYGAESFRQLLPATIFANAPGATDWAAPCVQVVDEPRFRWRGAMLDSARHFMPKAVVRKLIDLLALHKLNRFHWHLSDDQ